MTHFFAKTWLIFLLALVAPSATSSAKNDSGKEVIGKLKATLYIGTNGDISKLGNNLTKVDHGTVKRLRQIGKMRFTEYRKLGADVQPIFRTYENWLAPLKPSEEILLSFEAQGRSKAGGIRLDLEFWQLRRKVMKSNQLILPGQPLFIRGPKWRGGTLIIAVELADAKK